MRHLAKTVVASG